MSRPTGPDVSAVPASAIAGFDAQKMEALAQVAGGIAPALSDLLSVIRGQAGVLLDDADRYDGAQKSLNEIYTAAEKAGSLIRQLLIFSQRQTMYPEIVDLNGLIGETTGVLRRLLGDNIAVEFALSANLPLIYADPAMMEQILIILALNARDAMAAGGRLSLKTQGVDATGGVANEIRNGTLGNFVVLSVDDTGRGIAPEILPRVFEPFFTTKPEGRSAGLGLATVFGIARQHLGWVTAENAVNAGASFKIFLPAAPADAVARSGPGTGARAGWGHETILLVEDDAAVRDFTAAVLQAHGYRVLQAGSGPDALDAWRWHGSRVRLLLTDMVLEDHMSGLQLAEKLRAENRGLKVICTSGHSRDTLERFPENAAGCR